MEDSNEDKPLAGIVNKSRTLVRSGISDGYHLYDGINPAARARGNILWLFRNLIKRADVPREHEYEVVRAAAALTGAGVVDLAAPTDNYWGIKIGHEVADEFKRVFDLGMNRYLEQRHHVTKAEQALNLALKEMGAQSSKSRLSDIVNKTREELYYNVHTGVGLKGHVKYVGQRAIGIVGGAQTVSNHKEYRIMEEALNLSGVRPIPEFTWQEVSKSGYGRTFIPSGIAGRLSSVFAWGMAAYTGRLDHKTPTYQALEDAIVAMRNFASRPPTS